MDASLIALPGSYSATAASLTGMTKLRSIFRRHERRVWILWAIGVLVLVATPYALSDPALWIFVFDPELLALAMLVGVALLRESLSIHVVHLRAIMALRR